MAFRHNLKRNNVYFLHFMCEEVMLIWTTLMNPTTWMDQITLDQKMNILTSNSRSKTNFQAYDLE